MKLEAKHVVFGDDRGEGEAVIGPGEDGCGVGWGAVVGVDEVGVIPIVDAVEQGIFPGGFELIPADVGDF